MKIRGRIERGWGEEERRRKKMQHNERQLELDGETVSYSERQLKRLRKNKRKNR